MKKFFTLICVFCLICSLCISVPGIGALAAGNEYEAAAELVADIATTQYFTDEAVAEGDIEIIVRAGLNAPSAMNGQPWHFTVITDKAVLQQINEGMSFGGAMPPMGAMPGGNFPADMKMPEGMDKPDGFATPAGTGDFAPPAGFGGEGFAPPSGFGGGASKAGLTDAAVVIVVSCKAGSELDAGLACQNMSVAAQLLGYGSKIISSPTIALNGEKQGEYKELLGIPEDMAAAAVLLIGHADSSVDESIDGYTGATARNPMDDMVSFIKG